MTQPSLLEIAERHMADTSLAAFDRIVWTLAEREIEVFRALHRYVLETGYQDATPAELAQWMGVDKTLVRPRCTGLREKGWIEWAPARPSRAGEVSAHPVRPVLALHAVDRAVRKRPKGE